MFNLLYANQNIESISLGEWLVGLGTLALAIATFLLVREERNARKEANKPLLGLVGGIYSIGSTIPHWLYLRCSSGIAKELSINYNYGDVTTTQFCLSIASGEMILLDPDFQSKYEKGIEIRVNATYKYNSTVHNETLTLDLEKLKSGEIGMSYISTLSPIKRVLDDIERHLDDIAHKLR